MAAELLHEFLIFFHDDRCRSPIVWHGIIAMVWKLIRDILEQAPVGVAETIDTLLYVSNNQIISLITLALLNQWCEILPL